jgi:hypothetical protein
MKLIESRHWLGFTKWADPHGVRHIEEEERKIK